MIGWVWRNGGGGAYSFIACLSHLIIDHAPLSRRRKGGERGRRVLVYCLALVIRPRDGKSFPRKVEMSTSNIRVRTTLFPYITLTTFCLSHALPVSHVVVRAVRFGSTYGCEKGAGSDGWHGGRGGASSWFAGETSGSGGFLSIKCERKLLQAEHMFPTQHAHAKPPTCRAQSSPRQLPSRLTLP